jgi:lipopolysaccharide export system protein LptA
MSSHPPKQNGFIHTLGWLSALLVGLALAAKGDEPYTPEPFTPKVIFERGDNTVTAKKYGPDELGALLICPPEESDPKQITRSYFADQAPYFVHVFIDKNVIRAPVVIAQKESRGGGELEAFNGTSTIESPEDCKVSIKKDPKPGTVFVSQGKTKLTGSSLFYSQDTGIAVIQGPITFERPQSAGSVLRGTSEKITVDVDNEQTFLEGNVKLESKCRSSSASKVEYDDRENRAILYGNPAVSKRLDGSDEIKAERIEYNLETNDVTLEGSISGVIDDAAKPCNESGN